MKGDTMRKSRSVKILFLTLGLILIFSMSGCSGIAQSTTPAATGTFPAASNSTSPTPAVLGAVPGDSKKYGGSVKILITEPSNSLGYPPTMTGQTNGQTSSVALQTLFIFDENYNIVPLLATDYKSDVAAKTITLFLRQGVKFHDGTDFNADAVKWNLDQYRTGNRPELANVSGVDVVDNYTLKMNLSQFDNTIINVLSSSFDAGRIISPTAFKKNSQAWAEQNPVGTGPFQFVKWEKDVGITWKRFDGYWGGKAYLDQVNMVRIADQNVALMTFKRGDLDVFNPEPQPAQDLEKEGKYNLVITPEGQIPALAGYALDPKSPFADLKVRQAVSYAIDTKKLTESFGLGYYKWQNQWAIPGSWGYNPDVVGYPYSVAKAKQLLSEAGYPNGFDTVMHFYNTSQIQVDQSMAIQAYLKAAGINVKLDPLQRAGFTDIAGLGKGWDGIARVQGYSSPDPLLRYSSVVGGQNFKGIVIPDELLATYNAAIAAPDFKTKQQLVWKLESLATDKYCIMTFLNMESAPIFKSKRMHDDQFGSLPARWLSPSTWVDK
jgi:peptide/nickel transport system substrate-binding protein